MRNPISFVDYLFGELRDNETSIGKDETTVSPKDRITTTTDILKDDLCRHQRYVPKILSSTHDNSPKELNKTSDFGNSYSSSALVS